MSHEAMNKEQWITVFRDAGWDDEAMEQWHQAFEARYPDGHQAFLEWLQIPEAEIRAIRA